MPLTNAETQMALKARRQAAYKVLKVLALEAGIMRHMKDSDGYDEFVGLLESGEFVLKFESVDPVQFLLIVQSNRRMRNEKRMENWR